MFIFWGGDAGDALRAFGRPGTPQEGTQFCQGHSAQEPILRLQDPEVVLTRMAHGNSHGTCYPQLWTGCSSCSKTQAVGKQLEGNHIIALGDPKWVLTHGFLANAAHFGTSDRNPVVPV